MAPQTYFSFRRNMSEQIIHHEIVQNSGNNPFRVLNFVRPGEDEFTDVLLRHHWHSDLEIGYTVTDSGTYHIIDGVKVHDREKRCIVINSESIHNINVTFGDVEPGRLMAVIVIISRPFLEGIFPDFDQFYFIPEAAGDEEELGEIMMKLSRLADEEQLNEDERRYAHIYEKGLILQLLYHLVLTRLSSRQEMMPINRAKNLERIKGVISYIENHYSEPLQQEMVAKMYYFSPSYFSRFFHQTVGRTFVDYLAAYRARQVKNLLLSTDNSVTDIALECGFADARRCIQTFKKQYGITPYQFRLSVREHVKKR